MKAETVFPSRAPYLPDVGVICLVPNVWGGPWQPRHQVLVRLSQYFNVVWCNPPPGWQFWHHRRRRNRNTGLNDGIAPGFAVYQPEKWLPQFGRPQFLARWSLLLQLRRAKQILRARGCRKIILYLWRPRYEPTMDLIGHDLSCYHIDDEYTFSDHEKPLGEQEQRLILRADQVIIHSPALMEKKGQLNPRTLNVPNGVDYRQFATPHDEPADLKPIPHPCIGYVGIIKKQLDLDLVVTLARRHSHWSFIFVGPRQRNLGENAALIQQLSELRNVYFLGGKPVDLLPAYIQHLDVCTMCYRINDYTKFIYPLKLHEYLASGRPVVGSPIRSLQEFAYVVRLARTPDEWSEALNDSLSPAAYSPAEVEARRSVARRYDWNKLTGTIARTFCARLGPSYLERFENSNLATTDSFKENVA